MGQQYSDEESGIQSKKTTQTLVTWATNAVFNAMLDHYSQSGSRLSHDDYWKNHMKLTGFRTVDSWVQTAVSKAINEDLTTIDEIVKRAKEITGLR
jgi:hypothetical protein